MTLKEGIKGFVTTTVVFAQKRRLGVSICYDVISECAQSLESRKTIIF